MGALVRRAHSFRSLSREDFTEVIDVLSEGVATKRGRRGAFLHLDRVNGRLRARRDRRTRSARRVRCRLRSGPQHQWKGRAARSVLGGQEVQQPAPLVLDLAYAEDSAAEVDMNVVGSEDGSLIEVQGTAEHGAFDRKQLDAMLDLAAGGIRQLVATQRRVIA